MPADHPEEATSEELGAVLDDGARLPFSDVEEHVRALRSLEPAGIDLNAVADFIESLAEQHTQLETAARTLEHASYEVINQWGDPFEPEEQWEEFVSGSMQSLSEAATGVRQIINPQNAPEPAIFPPAHQVESAFMDLCDAVGVPATNMAAMEYLTRKGEAIELHAADAENAVALIDLIGAFGREVYDMLDDSEEVQAGVLVPMENYERVTALIEKIQALPVDDRRYVLGVGAKLQDALQQTFLNPSGNIKK